MSKILFLQEKGHHKANENYREALCFQRAFHRIYPNFQTIVYGPRYDTFEEPIDFNSFDLIVNCENHITGWLPDSLKNTTKPLKLQWAIDAHCLGVGHFRKLREKFGFDKILHASARNVTQPEDIYFPNCYDNTLIQPKYVPMEEKHQFGFCGSYVNRKKLLHWLRDNHGLHLDIWKLGDEMVQCVNSYLIGFNKNMAYDVNYRTFEVPGCAVPLITNYNEEMEELGFIDGENCMMYKNDQDIPHLLRTLVENPVLRYDIGAKGHDLVSTHHTYVNRAPKLVEMIK